jgi:uncharacterized membrane protein
MKFLRAQYDKFLTVGIILLVMGLAIYEDPRVWILGSLLLAIGLVGMISRRRRG